MESSPGGAGGACLPILMRDGQLITPPHAYTVKVILESRDGTLTNTLFEVDRCILERPDTHLAGISEMVKAADWAIYHRGEEQNLEKMHFEIGA